jgi:hypothetical protein
MVWIELGQDRDKWRLMNIVLNPQVPKMLGSA